MKISLAEEELHKEIMIIKKLKKIKEKDGQEDSMQHIVAHGKFVNQLDDGKKEAVDFMVMNRYYYTLDQYMRTTQTINYKTIFEMMIQIMSELKIMHENGYTYNDLKPENIMISREPAAAEGETSKVHV